MNLVPIITRLKAQGATGMHFIKGSVDFAAALNEPPRITPVQYVVLGSESDSSNPFGTQLVAQQRTVDFSVITVVEQLNDNRGDAATDVLDDIRQATLTALQGWVPAEGYEPITANGGRVFQFVNGQVWWQDQFKTQFENRTGVST